MQGTARCRGDNSLRRFADSATPPAFYADGMTGDRALKRMFTKIWGGLVGQMTRAALFESIPRHGGSTAG